jgi:hypothetical protein
VRVRLEHPAQTQALRLQHAEVAFELFIDRVDDERLARGRVVQHVGVGARLRVEKLQRKHGVGE